MANAHKAGSMAGHLGAAVVAGYFFGEDQSHLPAEVFRGVECELQRVIAGEEAIWFNAQQAGITPTELFCPLPHEETNPDLIRSIIETLKQNVAQIRQSGHNVIFASIAVRALHDHEDFATPRMVSGIRQLIAAFNNAHAGRGYYGTEQGWLNGNQVQLGEDDNFPMYQSIQEMVDVTICELIDSAAKRKRGFGGLWHLINHAAAITELQRIGYKQVAQLALAAHRDHVRLWRSLPDVESEFGPVIKSQHDPRDPSYWSGTLTRDEARLTHRVKTLYGFHTIRRFVADEAVRKEADDAMLYLMA